MLPLPGSKKNIACDSAGICGKKEDVASLQDLLVHVLKGIDMAENDVVAMVEGN